MSIGIRSNELGFFTAKKYANPATIAGKNRNGTSIVFTPLPASWMRRKRQYTNVYDPSDGIGQTVIVGIGARRLMYTCNGRD